MKVKNNLMSLAFGLLAISSFTSCLKDDSIIGWTKEANDAAKSYVQLTTAGVRTKTLEFAAGEQTYTITASISAAALPTTDVTVKLAIDPGALANYNASSESNGVTFLAYPSASFSNATITIPAGSRSASTTIILTGANTLSPCDNYIAPITVQESSNGVIIADNLKTILLKLPLANPYQGEYTASGTFTHPTAGVRVIDEVKELSTFNCSTVETTVGDLGAYQLLLTINDDNTVTVTGSVNTAGDVVPDGANTYDPVTKTFTLHYKYAGGGGDRRVAEVLVHD